MFIEDESGVFFWIEVNWVDNCFLESVVRSRVKDEVV